MKHIIDLSPTPLPLALECVKSGVSYFGVCGSTVQQDYLNKQCLNGLKKAVTDPSHVLFDRRFVAAHPGNSGAAATEPPPAQALEPPIVRDEDPLPLPPPPPGGAGRRGRGGRRGGPRSGQAAVRPTGEGGAGGSANLAVLLAEARARMGLAGTSSAPPAQ